MDNEETKVLNPESENQNTTQQVVDSNSKIKGYAAAAAAGAAAGSGALFATEQLYAQVTAEPEVEPVSEESVSEEPVAEEAETPTTAEAIVMTDEGIRVAHVDDSMSFSEAFAAARAQVGAGGVFEWHGKAYGTYYETEWHNMSQEERADWQSSIDYSDVMDKPTGSAAHTHTSTHAASHTETPAEDPNSIPSDASYIDNSAETAPSSGAEYDAEVHVIGVAIQSNGQGGMATIAGLQTGDETAIVVDVESDGTIDIIGYDANHNNQLEQDEWHDASEAHLSTGKIVGAYVEEAQEQGIQAVVTDLDDNSQYQIVETESGYALSSLEEDPNSNMYVTTNESQSDDMPDYMNNANTGFMDA